MDSIRRMFSAVNKSRRRAWIAVKRNCVPACFNRVRRNKSRNSAERTDEVPEIVAENVKSSITKSNTNDENTKEEELLEVSTMEDNLDRAEDVLVSAIEANEATASVETINAENNTTEVPQSIPLKDSRLLSDDYKESSEDVSFMVNWFKKKRFDSQPFVCESKLSDRLKHTNDMQPLEINDSSTYISYNSSHASLDDFMFLSVLGRGSFGKVLLCHHKKSKKYFAMKALKKGDIIANNGVESLLTEKRVFQLANNVRHPFLVNLFACFQTDAHVCFLMEHAVGDLVDNIDPGEMTESRAVFYAACVVLGLKYLHENRVIHRDLKLANLLLDTDGYVKIADYGLCKEGVGYGDRLRAVCGTPTYMAPEILADTSYTQSVDWWCLGIIIFEMLVDGFPFGGETIEELHVSIVYDDIRFPSFFSTETFEIIGKLLHKIPEERLGSGERGAEKVQEQTFFREIAWNDLLHRKIKPPCVPPTVVVPPKECADNSAVESTSDDLQLSLPEDPKRLSNDKQELLKNFSYAADWFQ